MNFRRMRGVRFIRRAPSSSGQEVELRVTRMTVPHVLWWHSHVQPIIDRDSSRTDRDWNWLLYAPFVTLAAGILARQPIGYTVGIVVPEMNSIIPCALVHLMGHFPALDDHSAKAAFVWFLSTAPDEALMTVPEYPIPGDRLPKRLGTIALDVAVTHSLNHRRRGRVGLYADKEGGNTLIDWYVRRGMEVMRVDQKLPAVPRRLFKPSDGRYCYYLPDRALEASRALDHLR